MNKQRKIQWDVNVSILTNKYIMSEVIKVLSISAFFVIAFTGILYLIDTSKNAVKVSSNQDGFKYMIILLLVLFAITALFILSYYSNKYELTYKLSSAGIKMHTRKNQRKKNLIVNFMLFFLGLLSRSPSAAGTGLIAATKQDMTMKWNRVKKIKHITKHNTIILKSGFGFKMIVFCTNENSQIVFDVVSEYCKNVEPNIFT